MPRNAMQYKLLISCTLDVQKELNAIEETVEDIKSMFGAIIKHTFNIGGRRTCGSIIVSKSK